MFLLKAAQTGSDAFQAGYYLGRIIGGIIILIMLAGSFSVVFRWPEKASLPRIVVGLIVSGFFLMPLLLSIIVDANKKDGASIILLSLPISLVGWGVTYVLCSRTIRRYKDAKVDQLDAQDQQAWQRAEQAMPQNDLAEPADAPTQPAAPVQAVGSAPTKPKPKLTRATPVIVRCKSCMGKWKSTAGEAKDLAACPKCNAEPNFRIDAAG